VASTSADMIIWERITELLTPNSEPTKEVQVHAAQVSHCQHERHNSTSALLWLLVH